MSSTPAPAIQLREEWLRQLGIGLEPLFKAAGYTLSPYKISCGFPSKGIRGKAIGECFAPETSKLKVSEIFVHPKLDDELEVAATVCHEICHVACGVDKKHGPKFKEVAVKLGLVGKMTATRPGPEFEAAVQGILARLGDYPHGALTGTGSTGPKQPTRLIKVLCSDCEYNIRVTKKWIEIGVPSCPNMDCGRSGVEMQVVEGKGE